MDGIGRLSVRVFTSLAQLPVAGATVVITLGGTDGKRRLLSIQSTNSSGSIVPVPVDTPQLSQSTSPGGEKRPYASCDVWAQAPGFAVLVVEDVQIFPGVETYQGMELEPLGQGENSLQETDVRLTPGQKL